MPHRRILLMIAVACLGAAVIVPTATALTAGVRVEASSGTIASLTPVTVSATPSFYDSNGNLYRTKTPNALAALASAAGIRGFTWEAAYEGTFVTNIAGFTSLPDWSEGWVYAVNGAGYPIVDVAAIDFTLSDGDETLWTQSPDATFARASVALVTELDTTYTSGEDLTVTVKADDLAKVNNQADYDRYGLTDPTQLEKPADFPPVEGATVHVGSATYTTSSDGTVTIAAPADGSYLVWAEKPMDVSTWYVRSPRTLVNFGAELTLTGASVAPAKFVPGKARPTVRFTLSRPARVKVQIRNAKNKTIRTMLVRREAGERQVTWNGRRADGKLVPRRARYTLRVSAADTWGRVTPVTVLKLQAK